MTVIFHPPIVSSDLQVLDCTKICLKCHKGMHITYSYELVQINRVQYIKEKWQASLTWISTVRNSFGVISDYGVSTLKQYGVITCHFSLSYWNSHVDGFNWLNQQNIGYWDGRVWSAQGRWEDTKQEYCEKHLAMVGPLEAVGSFLLQNQREKGPHGILVDTSLHYLMCKR